ncbi:MAG: thiamine pyrophosphate-binding protein, partial [Kiritimatiellaeota bacterium]|nr:thiamine pyrophosphate-binding protein [Kiritimatiellota bacterium]
MNSSPRTGAQCIIETLEAIGCEVLFGYPGGMIIDTFDALGHSEKIHFVLPRHEQGAAHAADGYARATGKCGFCMTTSGPGATNTVTGLATANADGIPVICITGQVPSPMIGNDAFQEADICGITRSITKHNYLVRNVDDIPRVIVEAHLIATTGKPGVVLVDIPKDLQQAKTSAPIPETVEVRGYRPSYEGHPKMVAKLAEAINKAERPLLYVGGGVIASDTAETLTAIARKGKLPVTTTLLGLGAFPETDPLSLRMLGMHGAYAANSAVGHCDLLVAVGARFDDRVTGKLSEFAKQCAIAHIDIDPSAVGKSVKVDIPVVGHLKPVLDELLPLIESKDRPDWHAHIAAWKKHHEFRYQCSTGSLACAAQAKEPVPPSIPVQYVIERAYAASEGKALVCT